VFEELASTSHILLKLCQKRFDERRSLRLVAWVLSNQHMKTRYIMFPRNGIYYCEDTSTGKQTSLRTRDEAEAKSLLNAKNEAVRQPVLNLHIARAYLTASDPAYTQRTWQSVMNQFQARGRETSRERYATVFKSKAFNDLRGKILLETTAEDFFAVFKYGKESVTYFLKSLHNFALSLGWLPTPILAPFLWPKYKPKLRRGITLDEHQRIITGERHAERKLFYQLLWATGAAQSDAAALTAENIDWPSKTLTYFRKKTGSRAQLSIGRDLEQVLNQLPTTGILFPRYSTLPANTRACLFGRRCKQLGVSGVTLHCYRYAWAERAKVAGIPERFAQCALGHNSKAVHRSYAKGAEVVVPSLEEYEARAKAAAPRPVLAA
jgi:integrase